MVYNSSFSARTPATGTFDTDPIPVNRFSKFSVQFNLALGSGGAATLDVQGRVSPSDDWISIVGAIDLTDVDESQLLLFADMPVTQIRARCTALSGTGSTVGVSVGYQEAIG